MIATLLFFCVSYTIWSDKVIEQNSEVLWIEHKRAYGLNFEENEEIERRAVFLDNLLFINDFNEKNRSLKLAMNKFGHLRLAEIHNAYKIKSEISSARPIEEDISDLPVQKSVDWRSYKVITKVKDQSHCESCYGFSAVGAIESHYALQTGVLDELSVQEIVDCSSNYGNGGCGGGFPEGAYNYANEHGLSLETEYKYTGWNGSCQAGSKVRKHRVLSYVTLPENDEASLIRSLSFIGPVSVVIDILHREVLFYKSGIIDVDDCVSARIIHPLLAIGYNTEGDTPYYILKNSWGTQWGDEGYLRMVLGKNMCGIAAYGQYPIMLYGK